MNLLIVDDEPLILKTTYAQLDIDRLEMESIDMAQSAQEARRMMEEKEYQIILCDIVMPQEDGISFAKWVLGKYPDCKFIFLTAHTDFAYMKEAISMRSFDYILQPAAESELYSVIKRARMQISIEQKNKVLMGRGSFFSDRERDVLEEKALQYLSGELSDDSYFKRLLHLAGEERETGGLLEKTEGKESGMLYLPFLVQVLRKDIDWEQKDYALLRSIYQNIIDEIMQPMGTKNLILMKPGVSGDFVVLGRIQEDGAARLRLEEFLEQLENMRQLFHKLLRMEIACYCGDLCDYDRLPVMYGDLLNEQANTVKDTSKIYRVGQISGLTSDHLSMSRKLTSWKVLLNQSRLKEFKQSYLQYLDYYSETHEINRDILMKLHQGVSELLLGCMSSMEIDSYMVFGGELSYYDFMYSWKQLDEMRGAVVYVTDRLIELSSADSGDVVQTTIWYIRHNIDRELLVSELADRVGMSPEYLTRMFKKSTGMSLKRYIDQEKMEAAKSLLATTNLPVTIVSERVGYASYSNFSRSFRQNVGCTPTEFRERNKNGH